MKSLISIIAVILVVILAMGSISSLTESVGSGAGGGSSTTATTTAPNPDASAPVLPGVELMSSYEFNRIYPFGSWIEKASFDSGSNSGDLSFVGGNIKSNKSDSVKLIYRVSGLEVGKTYCLSFSFFCDTLEFSELGYRFVDGVDFVDFVFDSSMDHIVFKATSNLVDLCVWTFENPSDSAIQTYFNVINDGIYLQLLEIV